MSRLVYRKGIDLLIDVIPEGTGGTDQIDKEV